MNSDRHHDSKQWETLYRHHLPELKARLRRLFGDGPPEPDDLAQIAFARAIQIDGFPSLENPRGYLFRIAVNAGLDAKRRSATAGRYVESEKNAVSNDGLENFSSSNVYEARQKLAILEEALKQLSDKQREIIVRTRLKGETYAEIEKDTGWSKADISRQLRRALDELAKAVGTE